MIDQSLSSKKFNFAVCVYVLMNVCQALSLCHVIKLMRECNSLLEKTRLVLMAKCASRLSESFFNEVALFVA